MLECQHFAALGFGRFDDLVPISRWDVIPVAPLADGHAALTNISGHRFGVSVPSVVNRSKM